VFGVKKDGGSRPAGWATGGVTGAATPLPVLGPELSAGGFDAGGSDAGAVDAGAVDAGAVVWVSLDNSVPSKPPPPGSSPLAACAGAMLRLKETSRTGTTSRTTRIRYHPGSRGILVDASGTSNVANAALQAGIVIYD
jgi:hypothetical protein